MADKSLYITRPEGDDLYTILQRKTLEELQRISGEVWTDYNPHDPGVTVADTVNYALTEIDYKLDFDLEDYLTDTDGTWQVGRYGLFPASEVYPTTPVTADDYRRLVLARFPMVQNVAVSADKKRCAYDFMLRLSPYFNDEDGKFDEKHVYDGAAITMMTAEGYPVSGLVLSVTPLKVKIDFNHPLAGKTVHYKGEILLVRDATEAELHPSCGGGCGDCGGCGHDHDHCGCGDGCCH